MITTRRKRRFSPATVGAAVAAAATGGLAMAAAPDTSEWRCESCPFQTGFRAEYAAGVTGTTDDAAHYGSGSGYDESGLYLNFDGRGGWVDGGYRMGWTAEDLGLDSRVLTFEGGHPGRYEYRLAWREQPYRQFDTTRTVYAGAGEGVLTLPPDWVPSVSTQGMSGLNNALRRVNIGSDRQTLEVGGSLAPGAGFDLFANYRHQENEGTDLTSGAYFTSAAQLPRPFEYETDEVDLGVRFAGANGFVELAWYGSFFQPETVGFTWDNPYTGVAGSSVRAEPPENSFQQVGLSASYRLDAWDTVAGFSGAVGRVEQDETLLDYTINPDIVSQALPRTSLNGEVDTTHLGLSVSTRPHRRARVRLTWRYDERDNQSPVANWSRVIVDSFTSGEIEANVPYSFERNRAQLRGDLDLLDGLRLSGGYEYRSLDRTLQEVAGQDEDTGWGKLRWRPGPFVDISVRAGTAKREIDRYDTDLAQVRGQNPLLRKYNLAHRFRQFGELTLAATHPELPLAATLAVTASDDDYTQSTVGLTSADQLSASADVHWTFAEKASVFVTGSHETLRSRQAGSEGFGEPDWSARNEDEFYTLGGGLRFTQINDHVDLEIGYTRAVGTGKIQLDSGAGVLDRFPDTESELDTLRLSMNYRYSDRLEAGLDLRFDSFGARDWALQGVAPGTIPTVLALGAEPYDYDVLRVGIGFRYFLGARSPVLVP